MKKAYVITEGESDVAVLKKLLPAHLTKEVEIVSGQGDYGARSLAASILAARQRPVALVIDADTNDEQMIKERADFARWSLRQAAADVPFEVFVAVPSIESVFFQDQALIENFAHREFTDLEWRLVKLQPQELFANEPGGKRQVIQRLLHNLNKESVKLLQEHPLIQALTDFLSSVVENGNRSNG